MGVQSHLHDVSVRRYDVMLRGQLDTKNKKGGTTGHTHKKDAMFVLLLEL
jgi:hypothetical protein